MNSIVRRTSVDEILNSLTLYIDELPRFSKKVNDIGAYAEKLAKHAEYYSFINGEKEIASVVFYANDYQDNVGFVSLIVVLNKYQEKGIGKKLLQVCLSKMKKNGMRYAQLIVDESNTNAQNFYKHIGFHYIDRLNEYGKFMEMDLFNWVDEVVV